MDSRQLRCWLSRAGMGRGCMEFHLGDPRSGFAGKVFFSEFWLEGSRILFARGGEVVAHLDGHRIRSVAGGEGSWALELALGEDGGALLLKGEVMPAELNRSLNSS